MRHKNRNYFESDVVANRLTEFVVLGFAIKAQDNKADRQRAKAFIYNALFGRLTRKTIKKHKELYAQAYQEIGRMDELQRGGASLDEVLTAYGDAMAHAFEYMFHIDEKYLRVISLIAQWTFFIDMLDDYDDDVKRGNVNTLIKSDSKTLAELFNKHYNELIPVITKYEEALCNSLNDISCDELEWVVLHKIIGHSVATLVPNILNGVDVRFHYFSNTLSNQRKVIQNKKIMRKFGKHEKNPADS